MRVLAVMPTIPTRDTGKEVIQNLLGQKAEVRVFLNGFESIPPDWPEAEYFLKPPSGPMIRYSEPVDHDVVLFVDDDIAYPPDYVSTSVKHLQETGERTAIAWHGSFWEKGDLPISTRRKCLRADHGSLVAWRISYVGSGALVMWGSEFNEICAPLSETFNFEDDVWISSQLAHQNIQAIRPAFGRRWIRPMKIGRDTLWNRARADRFRQRNHAIAEAMKMCPTWDLSAAWKLNDEPVESNP